MEEFKCDRCGQKVYKQELHGYCDGTTEEPISICNKCMNEQMMEALNLQCNNSDLVNKDVAFIDFDGDERKFKVITHLVTNDMFFLQAYEVKHGGEGYEFVVKGEFDITDCTQIQQLEQKLYEKIQNGLLNNYLDTDEIAVELGININDNLIVGRFTSYREEEVLPSVVIDGIEYSWVEFGKILKEQSDSVFKMKFYCPHEDYFNEK